MQSSTKTDLFLIGIGLATWAFAGYRGDNLGVSLGFLCALIGIVSIAGYQP